MGSAWNEPINPEFGDDLQAKTVTDPVFGEINVYELIMERLEQFKRSEGIFHPFTGPIYDSEGKLRLEEGETLPQDNLRWYMD